MFGGFLLSVILASIYFNNLPFFLLPDFEGEIGQVCIFDYAIDQDQITYLYNLGIDEKYQ